MERSLRSAVADLQTLSSALGAPIDGADGRAIGGAHESLGRRTARQGSGDGRDRKEDGEITTESLLTLVVGMAQNVSKACQTVNELKNSLHTTVSSLTNVVDRLETQLSNFPRSNQGPEALLENNDPAGCVTSTVTDTLDSEAEHQVTAPTAATTAPPPASQHTAPAIVSVDLPEKKVKKRLQRQKDHATTSVSTTAEREEKKEGQCAVVSVMAKGNKGQEKCLDKSLETVKLTKKGDTPRKRGRPPLKKSPDKKEVNTQNQVKLENIHYSEMVNEGVKLSPSTHRIEKASKDVLPAQTGNPVVCLNKLSSSQIEKLTYSMPPRVCKTVIKRGLTGKYSKVEEQKECCEGNMTTIVSGSMSPRPESVKVKSASKVKKSALAHIRKNYKKEDSKNWKLTITLGGKKVVSKPYGVHKKDKERKLKRAAKREKTANVKGRVNSTDIFSDVEAINEGNQSNVINSDTKTTNIKKKKHISRDSTSGNLLLAQMNDDDNQSASADSDLESILEKLSTVTTSSTASLQRKSERTRKMKNFGADVLMTDQGCTLARIIPTQQAIIGVVKKIRTEPEVPPSGINVLENGKKSKPKGRYTKNIHPSKVKKNLYPAFKEIGSPDHGNMSIVTPRRTPSNPTSLRNKVGRKRKRESPLIEKRIQPKRCQKTHEVEKQRNDEKITEKEKNKAGKKVTVKKQSMKISIGLDHSEEEESAAEKEIKSALDKKKTKKYNKISNNQTNTQEQKESFVDKGANSTDRILMKQQEQETSKDRQLLEMNSDNTKDLKKNPEDQEKLLTSKGSTQRQNELFEDNEQKKEKDSIDIENTSEEIVSQEQNENVIEKIGFENKEIESSAVQQQGILVKESKIEVEKENTDTSLPVTSKEVSEKDKGCEAENCKTDTTITISQGLKNTLPLTIDYVLSNAVNDAMENLEEPNKVKSEEITQDASEISSRQDDEVGMDAKTSAEIESIGLKAVTSAVEEATAALEAGRAPLYTEAKNTSQTAQLDSMPLEEATAALEAGRAPVYAEAKNTSQTTQLDSTPLEEATAALEAGKTPTTTAQPDKPRSEVLRFDNSSTCWNDMVHSPTEELEYFPAPIGQYSEPIIIPLDVTAIDLSLKSLPLLSDPEDPETSKIMDLVGTQNSGTDAESQCDKLRPLDDPQISQKPKMDKVGVKRKFMGPKSVMMARGLYEGESMPTTKMMKHFGKKTVPQTMSNEQMALHQRKISPLTSYIDTEKLKPSKLQSSRGHAGYMFNAGATKRHLNICENTILSLTEDRKLPQVHLPDVGLAACMWKALSSFVDSSKKELCFAGLPATERKQMAELCHLCALDWDSEKALAIKRQESRTPQADDLEKVLWMTCMKTKASK